MRLAMLAPRGTVAGPLPKHTPLLVEALERLGCEVELLPWGRRSEGEGKLAKVAGRFADVRDARRSISRGDFPVVVVKTAHDWKTLSRDIALLYGLDRTRIVVVQFHGSQSSRLVAPGSRMFKRATRALLRRADGVLVLSQEERHQWQQFDPASEVLVVRNVRPPALAAAEQGGPRDGPPTILSVSRLLATKGVYDLVRALPAVRRRFPARLVLAGDGPEAGSLRALADDLGVGASLELTGYLSGADLWRLYASASVFALPTYHDEGFPTVILEAMAAGLPIVTTPARGSADHLEEGSNAVFVPAKDPEALAAALAGLLEDEELRRAIGAANRIKVAEWDPDPVAREYLAALEEIVAKRNGASAR
jgi:glycosyltransferase involved in cell wall biosynthesis